MLVATISRSNGELIQVVVPGGFCVAFIMKDGLANSCYSENKVVNVGDDVLRYDEITVFIYEPTAFDIVSLERIKISPEDKAYTLANKDTSRVSVLFPKQNDVITNTQVDFSFYYQSIGSDSTNVSETKGQQFLCMKVIQLDESGSAGAESSMICFEPDARSYSGQLLEGFYRANWYIGTQSPDDGSMNYHFKNSVSFQVQLVVPLSLPTAKAAAPSFPSTLGLQRYGPQIQGLYDRRVLPVDGVDDTVHVLLISVRTAVRYAEAEAMLKSLLFHRRAEEASTPEGHEYFRPLVIHMVTDESGRANFGNIWRQYTDTDTDTDHTYDASSSERGHGSGVANVTVVFHDFISVCAKPLESFLTALNMSISSHHSGVAGYCRLFLPDYFTALADPFASTAAKARIDFPLPSKLIVLETDQLVLAPITDLWDHVAAATGVFSRDQDVIIGAAENYQPWEDSRPTAGHDQRLSKAVDFGVAGKPKTAKSTIYHGVLYVCKYLSISLAVPFVCSYAFALFCHVSGGVPLLQGMALSAGCLCCIWSVSPTWRQFVV